VLNKHPIVSATIHGHEHLVTYTHMDSSRISSITHPFEEFVSGGAGAGLYQANTSRIDYWLNSGGSSEFGFMSVDVSGNYFNISVYDLNGAVDKTFAFYQPSITLRTAGQGEAGNSVEIQVIQDDKVIGSTKITRTPGSPSTQAATLSANIDLSKPYSGRLIFDTGADISGGTPVWVTVDGVTTKVTTFNTQKDDPSSYHQTYDFALP
jgi:hypothetical protein